MSVWDVRYPTVTPNLIAESVQLGAKARLSPTSDALKGRPLIE